MVMSYRSRGLFSIRLFSTMARLPVIVPLGNVEASSLEWRQPHAELDVEVARPFDVSAVFYNDDNETEIETETLHQLTQIVRKHLRA